MERSSTFTAVSGWGYCAMGTTAIVAAVIAVRQATTEAWLAVWLAEALVAVTLGLLAMHWKANRLGTHLVSVSGRRLFVGLLPALFAGGVMTVALLRVGDPRQIPGLWLLLYGVAVMQAGAFSVRTIPIMGTVFVLAGAIALPMPWWWANIMLAAGFGAGAHRVWTVHRQEARWLSEQSNLSRKLCRVARQAVVLRRELRQSTLMP